MPVLRSADFSYVAGALIEAADYLPGSTQEAFPAESQVYAAAVAVKQSGAQAILEIANAPAYR